MVFLLALFLALLLTLAFRRCSLTTSSLQQPGRMIVCKLGPDGEVEGLG